MKNSLAILLCCLLLSCVQKTKNRTIHFSVDMRAVADVQTVAIQGDSNPLSWRQNVYLTDEDGDRIYTASILFETPYKYIDVKFVLNEDELELDGKPNRRVIFGDGEETNYSAVFDRVEGEMDF
jgi:hypothetical protein